MRLPTPASGLPLKEKNFLHSFEGVNVLVIGMFTPIILGATDNAYLRYIDNEFRTFWLNGWFHRVH